MIVAAEQLPLGGLKNSLILRFEFNFIVHFIFKSHLTSNTRWESPTFHHDDNSSGIYSGGFSKSFGLEWAIFPGYLNKITTLNYTSYYISQHYVQNLCHVERNRDVIENAAMP